MKNQDEKLISESIRVAQQARDHGNHPFGALLVSPNGEVLLEAENTVVTTRNVTGHAETNLVRLASHRYAEDFLAGCTIYTSTEPCPMCAGAIFWANIRKVVFGLSSQGLYGLIGQDPTGAALELPCREVFRHGRRTVEVVGPILETEAIVVHQGFWTV